MANQRGRVVVITGASSGNGRATAHAFARQGAHLVLAARRGAVLETVVRECEELGADAIALPVDVTEAAVVSTLARHAAERCGRIDVWVNCAALLHFGRLEETPPEVLDRVIATNVLGYIHGARAALGQFRRQRHGTLINVDSVLGITAQPFSSAYVASKFAIRGLNDALRQEVLDEPDIHVCIVFPFAIDTPIYQRAANYWGRGVQPMWPRYRAEDVAKAIVRLVRRPRRQAYVGGFSHVATLLGLLPSYLADWLTRKLIETMQLSGRRRERSDGNVLEPMTDGWSVSGGWLPAERPVATRIAAYAGGAAICVVAAVLLLRFADRQAPMGAHLARPRNNRFFPPFFTSAKRR